MEDGEAGRAEILFLAILDSPFSMLAGALALPAILCPPFSILAGRAEARLVLLVRPE
jgi:hypothetical protein